MSGEGNEMEQQGSKQRILKEYFGHDGFREGQESLIDAVLAGRDVLGIMPTGAGKSMCFQIPALMLDGIALVVSPLISLMKDQVNALIQSGVRAAYLNSSLTQSQYDTALRLAGQGTYKLIYVAPERLCTPSFLSFASRVKLSLVAVDEAHCVSQWGQDFRPSYMRIPEFLSHLGVRPPVAAFTATATAEVKEDIVKMLGLREPYCIATGFDRSNLRFSIASPKDKFSETLDIIKRNKGRSGIIYCATRKRVEEVSEKLNAAGFPCTRYHAGLSDEERRSNQDDFIYDRVQLIAATNAFGMGIDKSNVGFVIHYNMPKNIESYYQEAGRAGRDGEPAECVLLYSGQDVRTNTYLIENSNENPDLDEDTAEMLKKRDMERLKQMTFYSTSTGCLREFILNYFGEKSRGYCGNCSNCLNGFEEKDVTVEAQKILSCIYRLAQRGSSVGAALVTDILRGSKAEKVTSRKYDTLSTYGIMSDCTSRRIRYLITRLEEMGCIRVDGDYSTLHLTLRAKPILTGQEKLTVRLPREKQKKDRKRITVSDGIYAFDSELFGRLKAMRQRLAAQARLPAYIIFSDTALRDICLKRPATAEELLDCSGIGRRKQQQYGGEILAVLKAYAEEKGEEEPSLLEQREKQSLGSGEMLFKLIRFNRSKLTPSEEPLSLSGLCDRILECLGISADKKKIQQAVESWLLKNNYAAHGEGGKGLVTTILSDEAGIVEISGATRLGTEYTRTVILPEGQSFIFENTDEIFA